MPTEGAYAALRHVVNCRKVCSVRAPEMFETLSNLESHHPMLENLSYIASIAALVIALIGFPLLILQLRVTRLQRLDAVRLSMSQALFAADAVLATHAEVAVKLRPGGNWAGAAGAIHPTNSELPLVEPYLGL